MQDDRHDTLIINLNQVPEGSELEEDGRIKERSTCGGQLVQQRQIGQRYRGQAGSVERGQEEKRGQGNGIRVRFHPRDDGLRQKDPCRRRDGGQGEEEVDGQEWPGLGRQDERGQQSLGQRQEDEIGVIRPDMPFVSENPVVAVSQTHGDDDLWWAPCINKRCLTKLLGKCCLPKQLGDDLEEERKILKRMERIEYSLSRISNRIDKLSQSGYVCNKHAPTAKSAPSDDLETVTEEGESDKEEVPPLEEPPTESDLAAQECPSGESCVGRMVSFNSSLIRSLNSDYFEDNEDLDENYDSEGICCSSSYCQGLANSTEVAEGSGRLSDRQASGQRKSLSYCKGFSSGGKESPSWSGGSFVCDEKNSSSTKEVKECPSTGKDFLSSRKRSSPSCKDVSGLRRDPSFCSKVFKKDTSEGFDKRASKETSLCRKEFSGGKIPSTTRKESSSCAAGVNVSSAEPSKGSTSCQKESASFEKGSLGHEESLDETDPSYEDSRRECSLKSQPTTLNCKIASQKESEIMERAEETSRKAPYSDDYEPYLIKKPDAVPRSLQKRLAKVQAKQGCR